MRYITTGQERRDYEDAVRRMVPETPAEEMLLGTFLMNALVDATPLPFEGAEWMLGAWQADGTRLVSVAVPPAEPVEGYNIFPTFAPGAVIVPGRAWVVVTDEDVGMLMTHWAIDASVFGPAQSNSYGAGPVWDRPTAPATERPGV